MDALIAFGLVAVSLMLLFYMLESRDAAFVLAFAAASLAASAYGFLVGAWPFGVIEVVWPAVALRRWRVRTRRENNRAGWAAGHEAYGRTCTVAGRA